MHNNHAATSQDSASENGAGDSRSGQSQFGAEPTGRFGTQHWKGFLPPRGLVMARLKTVEPGAPEAQSTITTAPSAVASSAAALPFSPDSFEKLQAELQGCTRCKLCEQRNTIVFGEGNPHASLVFVGEGPGEPEDQQGRPFVGNAGQLLDKMINAIGLKREDVYLCNVIKCRAPGNRNPEPDEIATCSPYLLRQLELIKPKVIVALGDFAAQTLLNTNNGILQLRGEFQPFRGAQLMPTFHPSHLLRNPEAKKDAWEDLKKVAHYLGIQLPTRKA
jgi:DNA polymerase